VIVVDEPMVGLDPKSSRILKELFREYTDRGHTVMMSTHTLEIAEGMCDRIGIMQRGELVACGTMDELRGAGHDDALEDIFLRLTGDESAREPAEVLNA
jgi:ABC-2 type transport system ATP-binding protein